MGSDKPRSSCGETASNRQIFIIGYLQFVESTRTLHCVLRAESSTATRKLYRRFSMSGIATPLKNEAMRKPQRDGSDV
jgi:hypothetical protein